jgi:hypothetical protein
LFEISAEKLVTNLSEEAEAREGNVGADPPKHPFVVDRGKRADTLATPGPPARHIRSHHRKGENTVFDAE